ncbi:MAG: oxidoreductase family protein [Tuberibacillus sp.]
MDITKKQILEYWKDWELPKRIPVKMSRHLQENDISVIKDASQRSIWRIQVPTDKGPFPVILKFCSGAERKLREPILYEGLKDTPVYQFFPEMYIVREGREGHGTLMFMECLKVASKMPNITPEHLSKIAPVLAQLHAFTFENRPISKKIQLMIPQYLNKTRNRKLKDIQVNLERAREYPKLHKIIMDTYPEIYELAKLNFDFPQIIESGCCLTHGDLTLNNIGYEGDIDGESKIKFIDYGGAVYAPCWLDVVKLIESPLDHHSSWDADALRRQVLMHYVREMENQGISFQNDPEDLYKYAFLMRVFEYEFRRNLSFALKHDGRMRFVFPRILKKIGDFSKELKLLD